jgi:hypothetical protein
LAEDRYCCHDEISPGWWWVGGVEDPARRDAARQWSHGPERDTAWRWSQGPDTVEEGSQQSTDLSGVTRAMPT